MDFTVCELFAGVGGFRCGLNHIKTIEDTKKPEKWRTVWFSQWEPSDKKVQWAHGCYVNRFGTCLDLNNEDNTNVDISTIDKTTIPDHTLLVGGFPCQDYSVSNTLKSSKGIEGKKGVLWWDIRDIIEKKRPPFVLLENVDRLVKSPAKQRGRDFGIILACFRDLGYDVEWRIINAAEYGYQQRRRRTFIFAYRNDTKYAQNTKNSDADALILRLGFFADTFPVEQTKELNLRNTSIFENIGDVSDKFAFTFENSGIMLNGIIYTGKTIPVSHKEQITLGDIIEKKDVSEEYFISDDRLYYTDKNIDHSDERSGNLSSEQRRTWQYIKGAKKIWRKAANGHEYLYSEGAVPMIDTYDKPARTMLTSEGSFSRTTHIVKDKMTGKLRLLTPVECERIQGFPDNWTENSLINGEMIPTPINKRRFLMGNALVVDLVSQMENKLSEIVKNE